MILRFPPLGRSPDLDDSAVYGVLQGGQPFDSCTILTTTANDHIKPLHIRMPVILPPRDYHLLLDPGVQDVDRLQSLLRTHPPEEVQVYQVSTRVNNPASDIPECIEPLPREG